MFFEPRDHITWPPRAPVSSRSRLTEGSNGVHQHARPMNMRQAGVGRGQGVDVAMDLELFDPELGPRRRSLDRGKAVARSFV
jgi:hypothetical protein